MPSAILVSLGLFLPLISMIGYWLVNSGQITELTEWEAVVSGLVLEQRLLACCGSAEKMGKMKCRGAAATRCTRLFEDKRTWDQFNKMVNDWVTGWDKLMMVSIIYQIARACHVVREISSEYLSPCTEDAPYMSYQTQERKMHVLCYYSSHHSW